MGASGVANESRSPNSGYRMAAKGLQLPWRRNGGAIPTKSDVIREMSAEFLDFAEIVFDEMAPFVNDLIVWDMDFAIALRGNDGRRAAFRGV